MAWTSLQTEQYILGLLIDGLSSFGSLYAYLIRENKYSRELGPSSILDVLEAMERRKWVTLLIVTDDQKEHTPPNSEQVEARAKYEKWLKDAPV